MSLEKKIDFERKRDFGQKIGAAFAFVRQNFRGLLLTILRVAGIPMFIFIFGLASASYFFLPITNFEEIGLAIIAIIGALIVFGVLWLALFYGSIYEYILLYIAKNFGQFTPADVSRNVKENLGKHIVTIISLACFIFISSFVAFFIIGLLAPNLPGFLSFVFSLLVIVPGAYLGTTSVLYIVVRFNETISPIEGLKRAFYLIKGKWWSTFGLLFIFGLISMAVNFAMNIPYMVASKFIFISNLGETSTDSLLSVFMSIFFNIATMLASALVSMVMFIALAFQYYNLVERKEARGLMQKIQTIGTPQEVVIDEDEDY